MIPTNTEQHYPIGEPNKKWGDNEKLEWLQQQTIQRSYKDDVLRELEKIGAEFEPIEYGKLSIDNSRYPLMAVKSRAWDDDKLTALVTGGVHGYETSGVLGAIEFFKSHAQDYADDFNIMVLPCISPWGYETINRWNPKAVDPNRSFVNNSVAEEAAAAMLLVATIKTPIDLHIDLHETTDTDNSEFRPALSARDNVEHDIWDIPDGFYLVGDTLNPNHDFQAAIIEAVSKVTHIAEADESGKIIGEEITQFGVINYATKELGLCTGFTNSRFNTTTEVYPDSPRVDGENCIAAQVTAITSALDFVLNE